MNLDANTEAIIAMCWARMHELPDDAFLPHRDGPETARIEDPNDGESLSHVRLFGQGVLSGPAWALDAARPYDDDALTPHRLLTLAAGHGPRLLGEAALAYTDRYIEHPDLAGARVTDDPAAVTDLMARCPADDIGESGVEEMTDRWVLLDAADLPVALAGYQMWGDIIAHLGVLTALDDRRRGHGGLVAAAAVNEALDAGLVPQWRARLDNRSSLALASVLGFERIGTQTTILLSD
ncbi:MAG: GNAT family N-acetyltransferase [Propionibacteriales bacterium]|nr:GNAT family N-acetyltransferase [Propionibacteriales bacterium]